jgi:MoaA/NifB/PqqE/SkfB family radical SAM enzyme
MKSKIIKNYLPEIIALGFIRSRPNMVGVNLTKRCNQHCIYCEIGQGLPSASEYALTYDDLKWIIDQLAENKIRKISLCGGEPFLFKGIIDLVAYAKTKNVRCSITTNGMTTHMLNDEELVVLKECNAEINISIDSFQESIQTLTRGTNSALSNALLSIKKLLDKNIPVTVLTAISKYNYQELFKSLTIAYEKGITQVLFQPIIYFSNYPDIEAIAKKSQLNVGIDKLPVLTDELRKILQFEKRHKINTNVYRIYPWIKHYLITAETQNGKWFFNSVLRKFFCREIYAIIDIGYDGGIQPCGLLPATIYIQENRQSSLLDLWSQATSGIRSDIRDGNYHTYCNGCCHHFSRNMMASIFKHPFKNRAALIKIMPLLFSRMQHGLVEKFLVY